MPLRIFTRYYQCGDAQLPRVNPLVQWCITSTNRMKVSSRLRFRFVIGQSAAFLGGMIALAWGTPTMAFIIDGQQLQLDFTNPDVAAQAN